MVAPIDYSISGIPDALQSAMQGIQFGQGLQQMQQQQTMLEQQKQAQAQMQADMSALASNPNASNADYSAMMVKYPQFAEQLKKGWEVLSPQRSQALLNQASQVYSAFQSDKPEIAIDLLKRQREAAINSGDRQSVQHLDAVIGMAEYNPVAAKNSMRMTLMAAPGGDKVIESLAKLGGEERAQALAPEELKQKRAEATIKTEEAATAHQRYLNDLEKQGWDIKKVQEDISASKEGTRLKAMEMAMKKDMQPLEKQALQLKIDEAKQNLGDKMREKVASAQGAAASIDNLSNTVDRLLKNPSLNSVIGSMEGGTLGDIKAYFAPGDERYDAISIIEQLGSQAFIAQIPQMKGTGSLSEKEGDKLQASLQNLGRKQSESQFRYNLEEVQRLMGKARKRLADSTGVPLGAPDRPNAPARTESAGPAASGTPANQQRNVVVDF